jgi:hypothetical protein
MTKEQRRLEVAAMALYNAHRGPNKTTMRWPPVWEDMTNEAREFVRVQARSVITALERFDADSAQNSEHLGLR